MIQIIQNCRIVKERNRYLVEHPTVWDAVIAYCDTLKEAESVVAEINYLSEKGLKHYFIKHAH